ncbi:aquaporin NIP1-3-like [Zingiber officinale]|uniref:Uncharacterized protein n=1 Tax=Zingiber officinale TaxID=94328 RepID=A0A8J5G5I2_ZINOF|nr:aquaporin NIP1-3-like [Zingiber officinale]KAG6498772.1 hypothetical protein ZIOFF_038494 [Zingiber officinale]
MTSQMIDSVDEATSSMEEGAARAESNAEEQRETPSSSSDKDRSCSVLFYQKVLAEIFGTYFLIFAGCASVVVNLTTKGVVTFPGICVVWGLAVTALVYSLGHVSGAHFNPAVTVAFAASGRFPWKHVPAYLSAQVLASTLASGTLKLLFGGNKRELFYGTVPAGSDLQSLVLEFIISFALMFVISGVATDHRAIGGFSGIVVGATVLLNVLIAGPTSGASMNPARTLGPAIVLDQWRGIWVYILGPTAGTVAGAAAYNLLRVGDKPVREINT